jgi:hypothetical protein
MTFHGGDIYIAAVTLLMEAARLTRAHPSKFHARIHTLLHTMEHKRRRRSVKVNSSRR